MCDDFANASTFSVLSEIFERNCSILKFGVPPTPPPQKKREEEKKSEQANRNKHAVICQPFFFCPVINLAEFDMFCEGNC